MSNDKIFELWNIQNTYTNIVIENLKKILIDNKNKLNDLQIEIDSFKIWLM